MRNWVQILRFEGCDYRPRGVENGRATATTRQARKTTEERKKKEIGKSEGRREIAVPHRNTSWGSTRIEMEAGGQQRNSGRRGGPQQAKTARTGESTVKKKLRGIADWEGAHTKAIKPTTEQQWREVERRQRKQKRGTTDKGGRTKHERRDHKK